MSQSEQNNNSQKQNQNNKDDGTDFVPTSFKVLGKKENQPVFNDIPSKIAESERLKKEGNEFFKQKDYKKAISSYNKAILYVTGLVGETDEHYQYGNAQTKLNKEQEAIVNELKSSTYLNISQIDIFNKNYQKCVERATKSLNIKQTAKGYYRRGIANLELNNFDNARSDFNKCLDLDNSLEQDIQQRLQVLKQKEKAEDKKSSGFYKKMFN